MCYCRTESPRPAMWTPTVRSTASAVSRVTVVPKVKSAPWHQVHLAHIWKVQWNLSSLMLCIVACFFIYLNYLVPEHVHILFDNIVLNFWIFFSLQSIGDTNTLTTPSKCKLSPISGCVWWGSTNRPHADYSSGNYGLFSLCINNSKTLNSNHEICSGAL